jgi:peptide deformylase
MYSLVNDDSELLREPCIPFDFANPPIDPQELFEKLKLTMIANMGVGLSANQVGLPYSVFVFGDPTDPGRIQAVFNPKVLHESEDEQLIEEGCLSFPGLFIKIKRPSSIRVRYAGTDGEVNTFVYDGIPARIFLHEYDHMNGITFHTRSTQLRLAMGLKQKRKLDRVRKINAMRGQ